MEKIYAVVISGVVSEIIPTFNDEKGNYVEVYLRYPPYLVEQMVEITDLTPMPDQRWTYDGQTFSAPVPHTPSAAEILASNTATRDALLDIATRAINPLQDAVDIDDATAADIALLKKWKQFRVSVNRADLEATPPAWPKQPK